MSLIAPLLIGTLLAGVSAMPARAVTVRGTIFYEKIPVTTRGLDLQRPVTVPAPRVLVELRAAEGSAILVQGFTDDQGAYRLEVPGGTTRARLVVWSVSNRVQVLNPATGS